MALPLTLSFHGAAGTVTGSRHLLEAAGQRVLVDAGLFQGLKELRLLNWQPPAFDPAAVDHVLLTHAHIDHAGYLPRLVREGFGGPIHCTTATAELAALLLPDAAHLQEEDAAYANKKGFTRHRPALPLFTREDAQAALGRLSPVSYGQWIELAPGLRARFLNAGHILGSAMVEVRVAGRGGAREFGIVFSGDVGRYDAPLHTDPVPFPACDALVIESTYGDRRHDATPLTTQLAEPLSRAFARGGVVIIPAFAVGRAQQVTLLLRELMDAGTLPAVPVHVDSPMAVDATRIYGRHLHDHTLDEGLEVDGRSRLFPTSTRFHRTAEESKQLNELSGPRIILSASGMLTGGRVLHHLAQRLPDPRNLVLLVGFQAVGTRGRALAEGAKSLRMHGTEVEVSAEVVSVHGFSAHADSEELLRWARSGGLRPRAVFVVHGEPEASRALARGLQSRLGWRSRIPHLREAFSLAEAMGN